MVNLESINFESILTFLVDKSIDYLPKLLTAILTLIIGLWIIRILVRFIKKQMAKKKVEVSLQHFLATLFSISLKIMLFITVISMFGVQMTSFIAVLAAAGLAIGLALQGSLANFAGGVLILLLKPFRVGDFIEAQGYMGTVKKIHIFNTYLNTVDNKVIILPNGSLSNSGVTNYSVENTRRVDLVFGIGYGDSIPKARKVIEKVVDSHGKVFKDPAPQIVVAELGDSSVNFKVRLWCESVDYWNIFFYMQENVKIEFDKAKISIPFPQRDVHTYKH